MRLLVGALVMLLAGCVVPPDPTASSTPPTSQTPVDGGTGAPIVTVAIKYDSRTNPDGSPYQGAFVHGCAPPIRVAASERRAYLQDYEGQDDPAAHLAGARAALTIPGRDPEYTNGAGHQWYVPNALPFTAKMRASQSTPVVEVRLSETDVLVDGTRVEPGTTTTRHYSYDWSTGRQTIHVEETDTITYHGRWNDPFRVETAQMCR